VASTPYSRLNTGWVHRMRLRNYTAHKMDGEALVLNTLTSTRGRTAVASGSHGTVIRLVRQALGLHQSHVASRSGYSQATISRIEQNRLRDPVVLMDLADALSIPRGIFGSHDGLTVPNLEDMVRCSKPPSPWHPLPCFPRCLRSEPWPQNRHSGGHRMLDIA
jgi:DNA-binding XRE family transcriptional regulator